MSARVIMYMGFLTTTMFASGSAEHGTDIIPRTVNFLIFAAILYYLVAEPVKNFFKNRSATIAASLEEVQRKLKLAKEERQKAEAELYKAKQLAAQIQDTVKKEITLLKEEIARHTEQEIAALKKSFTENMELERRKRIRQITQEVLEELFDEKSMDFDKEHFVNLIVKKVA